MQLCAHVPPHFVEMSHFHEDFLSPSFVWRRAVSRRLLFVCFLYRPQEWQLILPSLPFLLRSFILRYVACR